MNFLIRILNFNLLLNIIVYKIIIFFTFFVLMNKPHNNLCEKENFYLKENEEL